MENKNLETSPEAINTEQNQQPDQPLRQISSDDLKRLKYKRITITFFALLVVALTVGGILLLRGATPTPIAPIEPIHSIPQDLATCSVDNECVVVPYKDCCASKRAVNKKYEQDYLNNPEWQVPAREQLELCKTIRCTDTTANLNYAKCENNECKLTPEPSRADISTWQTYRNDEFGFEVKYPPLWSDNSSGDGATLGENRIDIGIIVWNDGSTEYVETQWKQIDCAPGNDPNGGCSPLYNKEENKLSLNSYTVYFKIDGRGQMHAYIPNRAKNKTVEIYTVYLTDRKIFDQILSTFRFLE